MELLFQYQIQFTIICWSANVKCVVVVAFRYIKKRCSERIIFCALLTEVSLVQHYDFSSMYILVFSLILFLLAVMTNIVIALPSPLGLHLVVLWRLGYLHDPLGYTEWNFHQFPKIFFYQKGQWLEIRLSTVPWSSRLGRAAALQVGSLVKGFGWEP